MSLNRAFQASTLLVVPGRLWQLSVPTCPTYPHNAWVAKHGLDTHQLQVIYPYLTLLAATGQGKPRSKPGNQHSLLYTFSLHTSH